MITHDWALNAARREALRAATSDLQQVPAGGFEVVLTHNEVNDRHGTGILVQRLFPYDENVISVRAYSQWNGEQSFGRRQLVIPDGLDRVGMYSWIVEQMARTSIERVICIPFSDPEVLASIALHDVFGVPFCLYLMDDQNVLYERIPDALMGEAIEKACLRLAISSDMRDAYETKYASRFHVAPPTTSPTLRRVATSMSERNNAVLVGNIWGRSWLEALRQAIAGSALRVDWFASTATGGMLNLDNHAELAAEGIDMHPPLPESELASRLQYYEVALVPTVPGGRQRENAALALSLPSRVVFLLGASDVPIFVLGDSRSFAARFVEHYSLGVACSYSATSLESGLERVRQREWRLRQKESLERLRDLFTVDMATWFREVLTGSDEALVRFDHLEVLPAAFVRRYHDDAPVLGPWLEPFNPVVAAFTRLKHQGYRPDFVLDVGASTGVWSSAASRVYPNARYILVEPLYSRYDEQERNTFAHVINQMEVCEIAIGSEDGTAAMTVDENLYRSNTINEDVPGSSSAPEEVPLRKLDTLAEELGLRGRGVLKLDIQGAEIEALAGGRRLLADRIDVIVAEMQVDPDDSEGATTDLVRDELAAAGFVWFDEIGDYRDPATGILQEKDLLYVREDHPLVEKRRSL